MNSTAASRSASAMRRSFERKNMACGFLRGVVRPWRWGRGNDVSRTGDPLTPLMVGTPGTNVHYRFPISDAYVAFLESMVERGMADGTEVGRTTRIDAQRSRERILAAAGPLL